MILRDIQTFGVLFICTGLALIALKQRLIGSFLIGVGVGLYLGGTLLAYKLQGFMWVI